MKCAIMQPYFLPYIGYFQLINAVDCFVIYDDVNYIKGGWVNRNFILGKNKPQRLTVQLSGASPNKLINQINLGNNAPKVLKTIKQTYSKAPFFFSVYPLIEKNLDISNSHKSLSRLLYHLILDICDYLSISTEVTLSSSIEKNNALKGSLKVLDICKKISADTYINAIGGKDLYDKHDFKQKGLELYFLNTEKVLYKQFDDNFIPNLSIVDILMFNSREDISSLLRKFTLA